MKHLLFVTNLFPRPDMPQCATYNAQLLLAVACRLRKQGGRVSVLVLVAASDFRRWSIIRQWRLPTTSDALSQAGVSVYYEPAPHVPVIGRDLAWRFCGHACHRRENLFADADVVVGSWLYPDCVAAELLARRHGCAFFARAHGTDRFHLDAPVRGARTMAMLHRSRRVLVNCGFMRDELVARGLSGEQIAIVPNGVDQTRFGLREKGAAVETLRGASQGAAEGANTALMEASDTKTVLYVGNLVGIKGPDRLVEACAGLPLCRLLIVGSGPMRRALERRCEELGVQERVHFLGPRPHAEVAQWMNIADCLCLPSRSEGMPNVVVEALASGTPVVATRVGDVPNLVQDGVSGAVVANGSNTQVVTDLRTAMADILEREWDRKQIRATVAQYTWSGAADGLLRVIDEEEGGKIGPRSSQL